LQSSGIDAAVDFTVLNPAPPGTIGFAIGIWRVLVEDADDKKVIEILRRAG